jgi:hypothetical protein
LLIEEQRTNLITYSNVANIGADWQQYVTAVLTANYSTAPDGTTSAGRVQTTTTGTVRIVSGSITNGTTYAASIWMKSNTSSSYSVDIQIGDNLVSQVTVTPTWQRFVGTGTPAFTGFNFIDLEIFANLDISVWGAQLEQGSFATSLIPTAGASVTRSADVASVNTLSPWWNASAGTFFIENTFGSYGNQPIALSDQAAVGNAWIYGDAGVIKSYIAGPNISISSGVSVAANTYAKSAFAFGADGKAISVNGSTPVVSANTTAPTASTQLSLGNWPGGQYDINGHIKRVAYYPVRLINAQLQALTL